jgi:hypothetical protein
MNIEHSTSNVEHRTQQGVRSNVRCSTFDVGCWMFVFFPRTWTGHARSGIWSVALCASMILLTTCGCQSPRAGEPLASELAGSDEDAQINFWHAITDEAVTTNDHAFHGLLLYMDGKDDAADYAGRVADLKSRKMLPKSFDEPATAAVRRGTLAVAIMRLLGERGGVTTTLLGPTPRYAVRELMFLNVYPPSTPNQSFSGNEFVGIIGRVEDYQRGNPENVTAEVLPGEMK